MVSWRHWISQSELVMSWMAELWRPESFSSQLELELQLIWSHMAMKVRYCDQISAGCWLEVLFCEFALVVRGTSAFSVEELKSIRDLSYNPSRRITENTRWQRNKLSNESELINKLFFCMGHRPRTSGCVITDRTSKAKNIWYTKVIVKTY